MSRRSVRQELLARWSSLSDDQRSFLRRAAERDRTLPHADGTSKLLPLMNWREIGASGGFADPRSDELACTLAAAKILCIADPDKHSFGLLAGYLVNEVDAVERERRWRRAELAVVAIVAAVMLLYFSLQGAA